MPIVKIAPTSIDTFIREVQQDQMSSWLSIHDELDLTVNTTLLKPIMLEINKIAELRPIFGSFKMPYLAFFMDNEYDEYGSFTAGSNANIEMYGMNFNKEDIKIVAKPKIHYIINWSETEQDVAEESMKLLQKDNDGAIVTIILLDGKYTSNGKYSEESIKNMVESGGFKYDRKQ